MKAIRIQWTIRQRVELTLVSGKMDGSSHRSRATISTRVAGRLGFNAAKWIELVRVAQLQPVTHRYINITYQMHLSIPG